MKAAILQCDDVLEKLKPQFGSYSEMIISMFADIASELTFEIFNCTRGEYPDDIHDFDFYITTGSKSSVYENETWIRQLIEFIQHLDRNQKKLIGICFGHQAIARAFNCQVQMSAKGWGVGVASNRILSFPEWMKKSNPQLNIIVSHKDQVMQLTDESQVIAYSDFCPYFMLQWNAHFLSIQGHPEFSTEYSRALMHERKNIIPAERIEEGLHSLDRELDNERFARWVIEFVNHH